MQAPYTTVGSISPHLMLMVYCDSTQLSFSTSTKISSLHDMAPRSCALQPSSLMASCEPISGSALHRCFCFLLKHNIRSGTSSPVRDCVCTCNRSACAVGGVAPKRQTALADNNRTLLPLIHFAGGMGHWIYVATTHLAQNPCAPTDIICNEK